MFKKLNRNQELATHVLFWISYYVLFSFIWAREGNYFSSFYLEFVYMPIRLLVTYTTILYLIPQFLVNKRFRDFFISYFAMLALGSIVQRFFFYFFFEGNTEFVTGIVFDIRALFRTAMLLNSTVLFVSSIKVLSLFFEEKERNSFMNDDPLELKSNRKTYRVYPSEIEYIEGMGNYVVYHISRYKKITVYQSLKKAVSDLDENFIRVHKSYIVNKREVLSYDNEGLELKSGRIIPLSKNSNLETLFT